MPISTGKGVVLKNRLRTTNLITNGVKTSAGRYVGHTQTVIRPNKAMTIMLIGLSEPPHLEGSRHTSVAHVTNGANVNIRTLHFIVPLIRILQSHLVPE
jgi:hypothetical protein